LGAIEPALRRPLRERLNERGADAQPWAAHLSAVDRARSQLRLVTTITTPEFAPVRHRTPFLHLELPEGQEPEILPGELVRGRFWRIDQVFDLWCGGELSVVPPALFLLDLLRDGDLEAFFPRAARAGSLLESGELHRAYFSPGVMVAPLRTPTLPPATTTNCVLVGEERVYIVDPATPHASECERLFETLERWLAQGRKLCGVLLTHHHADHVGAVRATAERYCLPVIAHPETLSRLEGLELDGLEPQALNDGEYLELGHAPDGRPAWRLRAHHTPGHAPGHLVFIEDRYRVAIVGDLISTLSTIVIDPPEGHMATYIHSLRKVLELDIGALIPAHGPAQRVGKQALEVHLRRRAERESKLLAALRAGSGTRAALLPVVYADAPPEVLPYAERSLLAGLQKLAEEGRAREESGVWSAFC